jgi:hypothetical protein
MRAMGKGFKVKENSLHCGLRQDLEQKRSTAPRRPKKIHR